MKRTGKQLFEDLVKLINYDSNSVFKDTSSAIVKLMSALYLKPDAYDLFKVEQKRILQIYNHINSYSLLQSFCQYLMLIDIQNGISNETPSLLNGLANSTLTIHYNKDDYEVSCSEEPSESGVIHISNTYKKTNSTNRIGQFHPLDMVKYNYWDKKSTTQKDVVELPAIYVLYMVDQKSYEERTKIIRGCFDVLALILTVFPPSSVAGRGLLLLEGVLAATDLAYLVLTKEDTDYLMNLDGEKQESANWFLQNWDTIYAMVGIGVLSTQLAKGVLIHAPELIASAPASLSKKLKTLFEIAKKVTTKVGQVASDIASIPIEYQIFCKLYGLKTATQKVKGLVSYGLDVKILKLGLRQSEGDRLYSILYKGEEILKGGKNKATKELDNIEGMSSPNRKKYLEGKWSAIKFNQAKAAFLELRPVYKAKKLEEILALWQKSFTIKHLELSDLRTLYNKYLSEFPGLKEGFNQAEFKIAIFTGNKKVETVVEFSLSGKKQTLIDFFGNPPKLPKGTIDILDDYDDYIKFSEGAIEVTSIGKRNRQFDSELKFVYNFLKHHIHKGTYFEIEIRNIFKTCNSCRRELLMLQAYAKSIGKEIKLVVRTDEEINGTDILLKKLGLK